MLDNLSLFITIVDNRSLSLTANQLGVPAATVTRRLQRLERDLGCQLINRSARQFHLTHEGEVYYQECAYLVTQLHDRANDLAAARHKTKGKLKVLAPSNISTGLLSKAWGSFCNLYPEIQLEISLGNTTENFISTQADIALRIGPQKSSALFQKKIGEIKTLLVASPVYLQSHSKLETIDHLNQHRLITLSRYIEWNLTQDPSNNNENSVDKTNSINQYNPTSAVTVNDIKLAAQLTRDRVGIALLPASEIKAELINGTLVRVLNNWQGPRRSIYAIWAHGRKLPPRATLLLQHLEKEIELEPFLKGQI